MTDKKSRRVVIINNINSETIDQAIFILKSDKKDSAFPANRDTDIVREAQDIISNYVRQMERVKGNLSDMNRARKKRTRKLKPSAFIVSLLFCIAICFAIFTYIN